MSSKLQKTPLTDRIPIDEGPIEVGQWYWVKGKKKGRWFGCVTEVGSNYAAVKAPGHYNNAVRIHFDDFWDECERESNPDAVIADKLTKSQAEVNRLLSRVQEITAQLSISPKPELTAGSETKALAVRNETEQDFKSYSKALAKAKKETLPKLFKAIEEAHEELATWMSAKVIPLKAKAEGLKDVIEVIDGRIFNVELYAGLSEEIVRITDGLAANLDEPVHLLQRRCYMDEECLAQYEVGGMDYEDLEDFDTWLARSSNRDRLLPFPRCIVSFRVRREHKHREAYSFGDFFSILRQMQNDERTFLYIRNGEKLYRLSTALNFGDKLFPDLDRQQLGQSKLWAKMFGKRVDKIIIDNEYQAIVEAEAKQDAEAARHPEEDRWQYAIHFRESRDYVPFDKSEVFYDDIVKKIAEDIQKHNRIALIIQGLLDRSPVLHPHPPWQIWTDEGFKSALRLIFDKSRALTAGEKPDFEAYRAKLNASIKVGSVTVGQDDAWELYEGEKLRAKSSGSSRHHHEDSWRNRPYGNPGPGLLARVVAYNRRQQTCTYSWLRERQSYTYNEGDKHLQASYTVPTSKLLNVSAYKAGDFHIFFDDPRTRADYLEWAPMLLAAEEFCAGNRKVKDPPPKKERVVTWEGQERYRRQKKRKQLLGKSVRLTQAIKTRGGEEYEVGTLWRVGPGDRGTFTISGINEDGSDEKGSGRFVRGVSSYEFRVDPSIPDEPEPEPEEPEKDDE